MKLIRASKKPSLDAWLLEAQAEETAKYCGMYLFHTGVVRAVPKAAARSAQDPGFPEDPAFSVPTVTGMEISFSAEKAEAAIARVERFPGIFCVRVWLNEGRLSVGDPLMQVLVGGDIRPRVIAALESLVEELKTVCVSEKEL